jgi:hypothetical protein
MLTFGDKVFVYGENAIFIKYAGLSNYAYVLNEGEIEASIVLITDIQYVYNTI